MKTIVITVVVIPKLIIVVVIRIVIDNSKDNNNNNNDSGKQNLAYGKSAELDKVFGGLALSFVILAVEQLIDQLSYHLVIAFPVMCQAAGSRPSIEQVVLLQGVAKNSLSLQ